MSWKINLNFRSSQEVISFDQRFTGVCCCGWLVVGFWGFLCLVGLVCLLGGWREGGWLLRLLLFFFVWLWFVVVGFFLILLAGCKS